jgi:hypothetical protein
MRAGRPMSLADLRRDRMHQLPSLSAQDRVKCNTHGVADGCNEEALCSPNRQPAIPIGMSICTAPGNLAC